MTDITMPQLGETVTEGTITRWFKQVGEQIAEDEPLFEVSTDKVDSEVPSPVSGVLSEIVVPEGETVDVGALLARVGEADGGAEAPAPAEAPAVQDESAAPAAEPEPAAAEAPEREPAAEEAPQPEPGEEAAAPRAEPPPPPKMPEPFTSESRGPSAEPTAPAAESEAPPAQAPATQAPPGRTNGRLLSPVVRRLIAENNLDPNQIEGTGPGGRITRSDVLATVERPSAAPTAPTPAAPTAEPTPAAPAAPAATAGERQTSVPHTNIRRRTAEHMVRSKQTSAHVYASIEVDFEKVEQARRAEKETWRASEGFGLTYLPFIARAVIDAVREFPQVNASFGQNELTVHNYVNLGIAVDLDFKGLMVPVIRDADGKRLRAIAREIADLAQRARGKQLSPDDIAGGTLTITNAGPFGTTMTLPIINQPQVAIVATDAVKRRPVVVDLPDGSEGIAVHSVGNLTLTWDHRAFDGAYAASFLNQVKTILETRDWPAELA
jgi:2-oxoglutarate dehydrogenase E2 component (dihydrolipoamide succinyltransferase)